MAIKQPGEFTGLDGFVWFFGIVEDRIDPLNAGRVRVRMYGWHSDSRQALPTESIKWAQVMMPITSASMSGIGRSATGLLEGTCVTGWYLDGRNAEQPLIIGSIPGIPMQGAGRGESGFSDPNANYPIPSEVGNPDTPKLAYDRWTEDKITQDKDEHRVTSVATASGPQLAKVSREAAIASGSWDEPVQRGGTSRYPFNHVTQTEIGHAFEVDDTPGCERIHEYHKSGTFTEVQPDGTRITKIVGSDYELVASNKNILITGACNVTINGDTRVLIKGDKIEEIQGDYHLTIHGSRFTKMDGNDLTEVGSARATSIGLDDSTFVNQDASTIVGRNERRTIGKKSAFVAGDNFDIASGKNMNIGAQSKMNIKSTETTEMTASLLNIHNDQTIKGTSTASTDHISAGISGAHHTHTDSIGLGAGITSPPNP